MKFKGKKQLSAFLIGVLVMMSGAPHLTVSAAVNNAENQKDDFFVSSNGTKYDPAYDPYIWDEDIQDYDEDSEEYADLIKTLASPSDFGSWLGGKLASPANMASASNADQGGETVVFTEAGPFLAPVSADSARRQMKAGIPAGEDSADGSGLILNKTAEADQDNEGEYRIRLEAYTTGKGISSAEPCPADIVLVLDQSSSMAYDFEGEFTFLQEDRRQYAMKQAVSQFIELVSEKFNWSATDHRMAVVTFGEKASVLSNWNFVDEDGKEALLDAVSSLDDLPSGASDLAADIEEAGNLMDGGYRYIGSHTARQKAVIVFTDSVPTAASGFDTEMADEAIQGAKKLKDGGVAVYSVGIFHGANPDELYGDAWRRQEPFPHTLCTGEVGSCWGGSWVSVLFERNDFPGIDIAAGNRFLNYLSTNSHDAEETGVIRDLMMKAPGFGIAGPGYTITKNYPCENNGYYLTADGQDSLEDIFTSISQNISVADIVLGTETAVEDRISPYFEFADIHDISVTTADYQGDGRFGEASDALPGEFQVDIRAEEGRQSLSVTGFDFDKYYVAEEPREVGGELVRGKKLVIEFNIKPREGFLGGNGVPTNGGESGAYDRKDGRDIRIGGFSIPEVDVPIPELMIEALPKNVYLEGRMSEADYREGVLVKCGDTVILGEGKEELEEWQSAYVKLPDISDIAVNYPTGSLLDDTGYTLSYTLFPKKAGSVASSETAVSETADILVYKPVMLFGDGEIFYGEELADGYGYDADKDPVVSCEHEGKAKTDSTVMACREPRFSFTYRYDSSKVAGGKVNTKVVLPVKVEAVVADWQPGEGKTAGADPHPDESGENLISHVIFAHRDCMGTGFKEMDAYPGYHFLLHVKTGSLTVKKVIEDDIGKGEPFVFTVKKDGIPYTQCTVLGNGMVTISELPLGNYEIEEETNRGTLAWRYGAPEYGDFAAQADLTKDNPALIFTCTNRIENRRWLNGSDRTIHERQPEKTPYSPLASGFLRREGIPGGKEEWLKKFDDPDMRLYGEGMRNKTVGGDR